MRIYSWWGEDTWLHVDGNSIIYVDFWWAFTLVFHVCTKAEFHLLPSAAGLVFPLEVRGTHFPQKEGLGGFSRLALLCTTVSGHPRTWSDLPECLGSVDPARGQATALNRESLQTPRKPGCVLGAWQRPCSQGLAWCLTRFPKPGAEGVATSLLWRSVLWLHGGQPRALTQQSLCPAAKPKQGRKLSVTVKLYKRSFASMIIFS